MSRIHVAAAVIRAADDRVLIARRPRDKHQGGLWEFPGGKVEPGESVLVALDRELHEELGIRVQTARPLIRIRHDYPDKSVLLDVWEVSAFTGEPHGAEGQPLAWVAAEQLADYRFPAANLPIVTAAQLPSHYLITPDGLSREALLAGIDEALAQGVRLLQWRSTEREAASYRRRAAELLTRCAGRARVMLKGPLEWLDDFPGAGWHLSARQLRECAEGGIAVPSDRWLAASCHDAAELAMASGLGLRFVTLSPVLPTRSHPGAPTLGWGQASALLEGFDRPAYLLGGLGPEHLPQAHQAGAQGIAAIRGLWPG